MNAPLSEGQFAHNTGDMMSMRRIKKLPAVDTGGVVVGTGTGSGGSRAEPDRLKGALKSSRYESGGLLDSKTDDVADSTRHGGDYYNDLKEHMRTGGPDSIPPVHVDTANNIAAAYAGSNASSPDFGEHMALGNGGHRVAIAHELGWKSMRTTTDIEKSGYGEESDYDHGEDDFSGGNYNAHPSDVSVGPRPGDRSYVPPDKGRITQGQQGSPGNVWHHGGGPQATHGLHTELHGSPVSSQQFGLAGQGQRAEHRARLAGQQMMPGMNNKFGQGFSGGNAGEQDR